MSERDGYQPGVPCWVAAALADPEAAVGFYTELFGWAAEDVTPPDSPGSYFLCKLRGRDVAAVGSRPEGAPPVPAWNTYIWVESADDIATKVVDAGGRVVTEPFDLHEAARTAVFADPAGALFCVWQPGERKGAQVVNEPGAWSMSVLNTRDAEGAKAFYNAVFGWGAETVGLGQHEIALWRLQGYEGGEPLQPVPRDVISVMAPMSTTSPRRCRRIGASTSGSTTSTRPPGRGQDHRGPLRRSGR